MRHYSHFCVALALVFSPSFLHAQEKGGTRLIRSVGSVLNLCKPKPKEEPETLPLPQNRVTSPSNAITPTGKRLKPFGEPNYWGPQDQQVNPEEDIAILPPLPDLRTPDQYTKAERRRNMRNTKYAIRQAQIKAEQDARRAAAMAEVNQPAPDPSTALIQVQSKRDGAVDHGRRERPRAADGTPLKPFNGDSSFVQGNELKYQWSDHEFVETAFDPNEGDELGILPPMPDLRTPDQVTKVERMRKLRNLKYRARQARLEAERRAAEVARRPTVDTGPAPSFPLK